VIVEDRAQIESAPAENHDAGKVGLPKLIERCGFVFEPSGRFDHDEGRAGDHVERLQDTISRILRYKATFLVSY
jgi:hypothetical protein